MGTNESQQFHPLWQRGSVSVSEPGGFLFNTLWNFQTKKINRHRVYDLVAGTHQKNVDHRHCQPPTLQRARKNPHYNYRSVFADNIECHIIADDAPISITTALHQSCQYVVFWKMVSSECCRRAFLIFYCILKKSPRFARAHRPPFSKGVILTWRPSPLFVKGGDTMRFADIHCLLFQKKGGDTAKFARAHRPPLSKGVTF